MAQGIGRTKGGRSTKLHAVCDAKGRPHVLMLTPGNVHDSKVAQTCIEALPPSAELVADKGYDSQPLREWLEERGTEAVIPPRRNRKVQYDYDRGIYKQRNVIERMFCRLKDWRRLATRFDRNIKTLSAPSRSQPPSWSRARGRLPCALARRDRTRENGMDRSVFLNGAFLPFEEARIPVMDRGFLFADGVYEVSAVLDGALVDNPNHLGRLDRSLREIRIANPYPAWQWEEYQSELLRRNRLEEGIAYIQVTRGVAEREFGFPAETSPTVVMFTQRKSILEAPLARSGAAVITVPDIRWGRRDIKSIGLLAQVLAKQQAVEAGAAEAFMVEEGRITEGASSTAFIITREGAVVTRALSRSILPGVTRGAVLRLAEEQGLVVEERSFGVEEAAGAAEVFYTSASSFVMPVISLDGKPIGSGQPGRLTALLRGFYIDLARSRAGRAASDGRPA